MVLVNYNQAKSHHLHQDISSTLTKYKTMFLSQLNISIKTKIIKLFYNIKNKLNQVTYKVL